jgi:hypothetical protein
MLALSRNIRGLLGVNVFIGGQITYTTQTFLLMKGTFLVGSYNQVLEEIKPCPPYAS